MGKALKAGMKWPRQDHTYSTVGSTVVATAFPSSRSAMFVFLKRSAGPVIFRATREKLTLARYPFLLPLLLPRRTGAGFPQRRHGVLVGAQTPLAVPGNDVDITQGGGGARWLKTENERG